MNNARNVAFFELPPDAFPILLELIRDDTGEVVWKQNVIRPCVLRIPGFGGQGFRVHGRVTFGNGDVHEEAVPEKV